MHKETMEEGSNVKPSEGLRGSMGLLHDVGKTTQDYHFWMNLGLKAVNRRLDAKP